MKKSRKQVQSATWSLPQLRFEDQSLTSFSGLIIFQKFFQILRLKERLRACVRHVRFASSHGLHTIILLLTVHLLLGWRRLRDLDVYAADPLVLRTLGLSALPSVATVSRALRQMDQTVVDHLGDLVSELVLERVVQLTTVTLDFDGSVQSTNSRATEGTAVGYNPKAKGRRSYYPLFATVAQTGQVLGVLHRPGNVHDSNGALPFVQKMFASLTETGFRGRREARLDGAHFSEGLCGWLDEQGIEFSISVPFMRFPDLKEEVEGRRRWQRIDDDWSFFEVTWKPKKWHRKFRVTVYRHRIPVPRKGPIQLEIFEPVHREFDYKAVVTNKRGSAARILAFHNGRGSQEGLFAEMKSQLQMDYLPTRRLVGNQVYLLCAILAHNLYREFRMRLDPPARQYTFKRACLWAVERIGTFRKRILQRAGRLTRPEGVFTLTVSANPDTAGDLLRSLDCLKAA
ncbi:MAG: IS1380 family transposase [Planctomycetota bacterium]